MVQTCQAVGSCCHDSSASQQTTMHVPPVNLLPRPPAGRVFRAAAPVNATDADVKKLYNDLGVKELIDLRSSDELKMLPQQVMGCAQEVWFIKLSKKC